MKGGLENKSSSPNRDTKGIRKEQDSHNLPEWEGSTGGVLRPDFCKWPEIGYPPISGGSEPPSNSDKEDPNEKERLENIREFLEEEYTWLKHLESLDETSSIRSFKDAIRKVFEIYFPDFVEERERDENVNDDT